MNATIIAEGIISRRKKTAVRPEKGTTSLILSDAGMELPALKAALSFSAGEREVFLLRVMKAVKVSLVV